MNEQEIYLKVKKELQDKKNKLNRASYKLRKEKGTNKQIKPKEIKEPKQIKPLKPVKEIKEIKEIKKIEPKLKVNKKPKIKVIKPLMV